MTTELKYDVTVNYMLDENVVLATILLLLPVDESGHLHEMLRDENTEILDLKMSCDCGKAMDGYRLLRRDLEGATWEEVEAQEKAELDAVHETIRQVIKKNRETKAKQPENRALSFTVAI